MARSTSDRSARARREETVKAARGNGAQATGQIVSSPVLVRLAERLGKSVEEVSLGLSEDVVRQTKFPVIEEPQPDGTTKYRHPIQVIEGSKTR